MALTTLLARDIMRSLTLRSVHQHADRQVRRLTQAASVTTNGTQRRTTGQILTRIPSRSTGGSRNTLQLPMAFTITRATFVSQSFPAAQSSPFDPQSRADPTASSDSTNPVTTTTKKKRKKKVFIPRKAAVELNDKTRKFFKSLLEIAPTEDTIGIMLHYDQSKSGEPRMVFSFGFVTAAELGPDDEAVSLEVLEDGVTPKAPVDAMHDGLPKLYVSGNAFLKVLGAKLDVDTEKVIPILYDREGDLMDPNA
jgi:hypothetical protein